MKSIRILIALLALLIPCAAHAQGDFGFDFGSTDQSAPAKPAWEQFKLNPKTRINLDFRNASVDAVLHLYSTASGIPIIKDPGLTGGISVESPVPLTLVDAFNILNIELGFKGYELDKQDNFLIVRAQANRGGAGGMNALMSAYGSGASTRTTLLLRVYPLQYANATALAKVINDVFSTTGTNAGANVTFAGFGGAGGLNAANNGPGGNATGTGFGRGNRGQQQTLPTVKASADDYSNSLIVNASSDEQDQVAQIISQIDHKTTIPQITKVYKLQYALSTDLQPVIQNMLTSSTPMGRAATGATNTPRPTFTGGGPGGFFQNAIRAAATPSTGSGVVSADTRTNALVVTATDDAQDEVGQVVAELDKPTTYISTTWVYTLQNARADVVANLLNQSFGNRTTNGSVGGELSTQGLSQTILSSSTSGNSAPGSATTTSRTTSATGPTVTSSSANGLGNQNATFPGRDFNGNAINVRNLTGQVTLVPNIDTNSIICVALPEDKPLVNEILDEMDQIPAQVMIETLVVEATLDKTDQLGIEYSLGPNVVNNSTGQSGPTLSQMFGSITPVVAGTASGLTYVLNKGQFQAVAQALETDTKFNVLSTPRIFTTNNATAEINISQSIPYISTSTPVVEGTSTTLENSYSFLDVGIILTVTPRISADGYVTMDLTQTANDLEGYQNFGAGSPEAPIVNQREAETTVSVMDGQTVVLGGIIENSITDTTNKVPILGDIPILGNLFRSNNKVNDKTELLVFMTPHVVHTPQDAERLKEQTESEMGKDVQSMIPKAAPITGTGTTSSSNSTSSGPQSTVTLPAGSPPPNPAPTVTVTSPAPVTFPAPPPAQAPNETTAPVNPATPTAPATPPAMTAPGTPTAGQGATPSVAPIDPGATSTAPAVTH